MNSIHFYDKTSVEPELVERHSNVPTVKNNVEHETVHKTHHNETSSKPMDHPVSPVPSLTL